MSTLAPILLEPELIADQPAGHVRVLALTNPFTLAREDRRVPEGSTLADILRSLALPDWQSALVAIDGEPVPAEWWEHVRPRAGHLVTVRVIPRGSSGGSSDKGWIGIIAGIVLIIVGIVVGILAGWTGIGAVVAGALISAGIGLVISGAATLLFPPPQLPKMKELAGDQPVFAITGSRNVANPWGAVPRVFGRHKIFPPHGALPFTELVGNDEFLHQIFVLGYGPLTLSDLRIGDTPLAQFTDVDVEIRQGFPSDGPLSIYSRDVAQEPLSIDLKSGDSHVRRTRPDADAISVDFVWPRGLVQLTDEGKKSIEVTEILVEYAPAAPVFGGAGGYVQHGLFEYREASLTPIRRGLRWQVPRGQYDVRITQFGAMREDTAPNTEPRFIAAVWAVLRTITRRDPITMPGLCKVAIRIRATDQLNGVIDQFNCIARSILPDYDVATDTWITRATSNPASIYREILQGAANARPLADSRLDLAALEAWHGECEAAGRTFSLIVEQQTTVAELLRTVTAVGRATLGSIDTTFGVVRDLPQTVPVQHFTPRNSRDFRGSKLFRDIPHAIKARFINPAAGWEIDERVVLDDGFAFDYGDGKGPVDALGQPAPTLPIATKFEAIQFFGVTAAGQAFKEARYHLAAAKLRPELYEFTTDIEHLVCTRGDLIGITHDVPLFGIGWGRLKGVTVDGGGDATAVTLDEPLPMLEDGTRYAIRIRRSDATPLVQEVVAVAGSNTVMTFTVPVPAASIPAAGDLFGFGTLGSESVEAIVTRIEMLRDLGARIYCVDAAPAIHQADAGPIPAHDPQITRPPDLSRLSPLTPIIDGVRSDESVLVRALDGALEVRIVVFLHLQSGTAAPGTYIEVRYRLSDSTAAWTQFRAPVGADAAQVSIAPVEEGEIYDIMLRGVNAFGATSEWATISRHTVVGKTTPPHDVTTFLLEGRTLLRWTYAGPPDLAGFLLRRHRGSHATWDSAQPLHQGVITQTTYDLGVADVGETVYLLKAVDVVGLESAIPATVVTNLGDPVLTNIIFTVDKKAAGFPGTHNGSIVGGNLVAPAVGLFWSGDDSTPFWTGVPGATFWATQYGALSYLTSVLPEADEVPCDLVLDLTVDAAAWSVQYRTAGGALFWSGTDSNAFWSGVDADLFWSGGQPAFLPWPGRLMGATRQVYEFLLETDPGPVQGSISKHDITLDVPDVDEDLEDVVIAAASTRLPITKTYRAIKTVTLTVQTDGNGGVTARVIDKGTGGPPLTGGPDVEVLNVAGVAVVGLVDAKIKGL